LGDLGGAIADLTVVTRLIGGRGTTAAGPARRRATWWGRSPTTPRRSRWRRATFPGRPQIERNLALVRALAAVARW